MTIITMIIILAAAAITAAADSCQLAAATADNPIPLKLNAETMHIECTPQLISMYGIDHTGALIQTAEYYSTGTSIAIRSLLTTPRAYRVVQSLDNNMAIITSNHGYSNPYIGIHLGRTIADGSILHLRLTDLGQTHTYTTITGASKTIALAAIAPEPEPPDSETILAAYLAGRAYLVLLPRPYPCDHCQGRGTIAQKKGTFAIRQKCPACDGTRRTILPTLHRITL